MSGTVDTLAQEITELTQRVTEVTSVNASAETLLKGLHDKLDQIATGMQSAGVDPAQLQALHELNVQLAAQTLNLSQAVSQNTPAAGTPAPDAGGTAAAAPSP